MIAPGAVSYHPGTPEAATGVAYVPFGQLGTSAVVTRSQLAAVSGTSTKLIALFHTVRMTPEFNKAKAFPTPAVPDETSPAAKAFAANDGNTSSSSPPTTSAPASTSSRRGPAPARRRPPRRTAPAAPAAATGPSRPTGGSLDPTRSTGIINGAGAADPQNFAPAAFRTADDPAGVVDGSPQASLWVSYRGAGPAAAAGRP